MTKNFYSLVAVSGLVAQLLTSVSIPAMANQEKSATPAHSAGAASAKSAATESSSAKGPNGDSPGYNGVPVLDPSRFFGAASMGYASAKACPEVVSKLFCYCGCDISDNHNHLIDCFTSPHGVDCHICQEEAIQALKMHRDGASVADIQKAIDQQYAAKYPWKDDSPAYTKYKSSRLWKPVAEQANASTDEALKQATANTKGKDEKWTPVLKPGSHAGSCCGKDQDHKK